MADLLAEQGRVDEAIEALRARADGGDPVRRQTAWRADAAERLATLLTNRGDTELAGRMRRFGLDRDGSVADGDPDRARS